MAYLISFFHSKQLLLNKQSQVHRSVVFIVQLRGRIYKVNSQLVLSPHLLPPHKEHHCIGKHLFRWQISHPALQVKCMLCVKSNAVREPWWPRAALGHGALTKQELSHSLHLFLCA